ncbi:hypothetical protein [Lentibacillus salicampi]|uniref:HMA domain-containing protein n=1 Tax=Lentibacillus salicampi TaxID=175306 RepID=A0A4Y9AJ08_9BACI|nr:hypothetical protein [Lentibacillus salicampi]TFJ94414.1 hypothetical protein E4U82_00415 [Lentibacillus salicampi]
MAEVTIFTDKTGSGLQQIEQFLMQMDGIERVLADTDDGEVRIEFDEEKISGKRIVGTLQEYDFNAI